MKKQPNPPSRRTFIQQGTLLAGSVLAAPLLGRSNFFSGADDTIKVALVGCGGRGTGAPPTGTGRRRHPASRRSSATCSG